MPPRPVASSPSPPPALRARLTALAIGVLLTSVAMLAIVVSGDNAVTRADGSVVAWTAHRRPDWLVDAAKAVTLLGHGAILAVLLVAVCAGLAWRGILPRRAALLPPLALAVAGGFNPLLKAIADRPRPPIELRAAIEHSSGFPSGHSTQSASAWITLGLVLWLWGRGHPRWPLAAAVALVGAIGITRVILAVHSPTDVLGGWAWGTAVALTVVSVVAYADRSAASEGGSAGGSDRPPSGGAIPAGDTATASSSAVSER